MAKLVSFEEQNENAAAIDIGSQHIFVSCDGSTVKSYATFTASYRACISDLLDQKVKRVCMEATGVYWIALHQMLEAAGMEVCLVNPKEVKQVKGRKTDVADACWMQRMFRAGLVRQSYIPAGKLKELRMMIREREDIIRMSSTYVHKMQKALELMNIKLTEVIAQIHGASGIRMIEAILNGERNRAALLGLCDKRIRDKKAEEVLLALEGNYNESWLFLLEQNLKLWKIQKTQLNILDQRIDYLLSFLEQGAQPVKPIHKIKRIRHNAPNIKGLNQRLLNIYGADTNCLPGVTNYTLLKLLGEIGTDMNKFPTAKHFVSWCGLSPGHNQSGNKSKKAKMKNKSNAGHIFREVAYSLLNSKFIAIGTFMRKLRGRKNAQVAVKAGARKIAIAFYNLLTKGANYVEQGTALYQQQLIDRERKYLEKLAKKHQFKLTVNQLVT